MNPPKRSIERLRQDAKALSKSEGISSTKALEHIARAHGFPNWKAVLKAFDEFRVLAQPTPPASFNFLTDSDVILDKEDLEVHERTAELPLETKSTVAANKAYLAALGVEHSIFEPTVTGLKKCILDATQPVRQHFELEKFHCFDTQGQGTSNRKSGVAYFVTQQDISETKFSLYRPLTKKGDPRMWFSKLPVFAAPGDQVAIVILNDTPYLFNLSKSRLSDFVPNSSGLDPLNQYCANKNSIAEELLTKLREIAKKPIKANVKGDTAVGMAIEDALGIKANASKKPDYKGVELKAGRGRKNRTTLFAQVPDWQISQLKGSSEILKKYGYSRGDEFKLYCTVSTQKANSQGLHFIYDSVSDLLIEKDTSGNAVATWPGKLLRKRLAEKHPETFWIHAESKIIDDEEHFTLISVTHTKSPLESQLLPLIEAGVITMDHLIKKKSLSGNSVSEKGPLFKINKRDLNLLFPEPKFHKLN